METPRDDARTLCEALVLREGRIGASSPEAVGGPLTQVGWADRDIELGSLRPAAISGESGRRSAEPAGSARGLDLAALARKPTLTPSEALAVPNTL